MSASSRILSGTSASWARIIVQLLAQVLTVPIFLNAWGPDVYGVWLAMQGLTAMLQIFDAGHARYLTNEFLRIGPDDHHQIRVTLWSGLAGSVFIGAVQFIVLLALISIDPEVMSSLLDVPEDTVSQVRPVLLAHCVMWWVFGSTVGIIVAVLQPFGYLPSMIWWGVAMAAFTTAVPAIFAFFGAGIQLTGFAWVGSAALTYVPAGIHMAVIMRRCQLTWARPSLLLASRNLLLSQVITLRNFCDQMRQQGIRLLLGVGVGSNSLTKFSTIRTGSNLLQQGLSTITNPLLPELMRYVTRREQAKVEVSFSMIWLTLLSGLIPMAMLVQCLAPSAFRTWTVGEIDFDPFLFAILSSSVLLYALVVPASALVESNNLLAVTLFSSVIAAIATVGTLWAMLPVFGLIAAGVAILIGEFLAGAIYVYCAASWLKERSMNWPYRCFLVACLSVFVLTFELLVVASNPPNKWSFAVTGLVVLQQGVFCLTFLRMMQVDSRKIMYSELVRILPQRFGMIRNILFGREV